MSKESGGCYFLDLEVEGLRCFKQPQRLDLGDRAGGWARWTLILGENGTGKTTLLQAIAAMAPLRAGVGSDGDTVVPRGYVDVESRPRAHGGALRAMVSAKGASSELFLDWSDGGARGSVRGEQAPMFLVAYGAGRIGGLRYSQLSPDPDRSLFEPGAPLLDPEAWLVQLHHAATQPGPAGKAFERQLTAVKEAIVRLLPDVSALTVRPPGWRDGRPSATPTPGFVECQTPYGPVPMTELSLGYRTMLAWTLDLAARMFQQHPDSDDPLAEPVVVLVDEIDLHMHPRWQRELIGFLTERFPRAQFVATAHSPLVVLAAAKEANLVLLRRAGDHVEIVNNPARVEGLRVDQLLTSPLFGLASSRSPEVEAHVAERRRLLGKARLTKKERARLDALTAEITALPGEESPEDQETMDLLRRTLAALSKDPARA